MTGSRIISILTLFLAVFALSPAPVQSPEGPLPAIANPIFTSLEDSLSVYFQEGLDREMFVGASVAVVIGDSIQLLNTYGYRDFELKDSLDRQSVFRIGSLSKGFAGVLAGMLVADSILTWEERVVNCIPDFRMADADHSRRITMAQLLSHTGGFPYHSYTNLVEEGWSLDRICDEFTSLQPVNEPGELYSYQNVAFSMAGEMMSRATGKTFEQLLQERIFNPLGMESASASKEGMVSWGNLAMPHLGSPGHWRKTPLHNRYYNAIPAGGINASITDMAKWMQLLLGYRPELISEDVLKQVFQPYVRTNIAYRSYKRWPGHDQSYYAMGWRVHTFDTDRAGAADTLIHHGGYVNGYRGEIAVHPGQGVGICVLFNSPTPMAKTVIPQCLASVSTVLEQIQ